MSFDRAHTATLAELARVTHERDELRRLAAELLSAIAGRVGRFQKEADALAALLPETVADPVADAAEDEAFREATARAADAFISTFHAHLDVCDRCASSPFNLCTEGQRLLEEAGRS